VRRPFKLHLLSEDRQLLNQLKALRSQMAVAAQGVYDEWTQDEEGFDEAFGGGGICDAIVRELSDIIASNIDCELDDGGWDGDDHAFLIVSRGSERYWVDIPARVYEQGGGHNWRKIEGVQISPNDVVIAIL
jgi:hypothetical protein